MNIFEIPQTDLAQQEAINLASKNRATLDMLKKQYQDAFNSLWFNPNATPQEILNIFGTNAVKLFMVSKATADFIKSIDPEYTPPTTPKEL